MASNWNIQCLSTGSKGNAYLAQHGDGERYLLDCGVPFKALRTMLWNHGAQVSDLAACLITHEHKDHSASACDLSRMGVPILSREATARAIGVACIKELPGVRMVGVKHDAVDPCAFLLSSGLDVLGYLTDAGDIPQDFIKAKASTLIIEANYGRASLAEAIASSQTSVELGRRVMKTHLSAQQVATYLAHLDRCGLAPKTVYVCHMSDTNAHEAYICELLAQATSAEVVIL